MAKTFTAPFAQTPQMAAAVCTAAATYADSAPTNTQLLLTAGSDGAILTRLTARPRATVTATNLLLWLSLDGGTTKLLVDSALMSAQTLATTTAISKTNFADYSESAPMRLPAGAKLYVGAAVALASGIVFAAEYTDF
jgi:hypothetical protein